MTLEELKALISENIKTATADSQKAADEQKTQIEAFKEEMKAQLAEITTATKKPATQIETETPSWTKGVAGIGEMACALVKYKRTGIMDERLKAAGDGMEEGTDSEVGFLLREEQSSMLLQNAVEKSDFVNKCTEIPVSGNSVKIPYIRDTDRSGGLIHGGIKVYWKDEEEQATSSKPAFGRIQLNLHKLIGLAYGTGEIIEDSPVSVGTLLSNAFTDAFAWEMDWAILNGSGAGQPMGILNAPCLVSITRNTASHIVYEDIIAMWSRMPSASRAKAVWVMNSDVIPDLYTMNLAVGMGGAPVYLPGNNNAANAPMGTLFNRPIIFTEHCQTLGTKGDIFLADFSQYLLARKAGGGIQTASSIHLKFDYDQDTFRWIYRVDGQPWWPAAVTPRYSSSTLSPFICVAT